MSGDRERHNNNDWSLEIKDEDWSQSGISTSTGLLEATRQEYLKGKTAFPSKRRHDYDWNQTQRDNATNEDVWRSSSKLGVKARKEPHPPSVNERCARKRGRRSRLQVRRQKGEDALTIPSEFRRDREEGNDKCDTKIASQQLDFKNSININININTNVVI